MSRELKVFKGSVDSDPREIYAERVDAGAPNFFLLVAETARNVCKATGRRCGAHSNLPDGKCIARPTETCPHAGEGSGKPSAAAVAKVDAEAAARAKPKSRE